jgi:hypothetical protein
VDPDPPEETPVPDNVSVMDGLLALLVNDAVPDAAPLLCGLNVSVTEAVLPAAIVNGSLMPLMVYSALLVPADEITTLDPLALSVPIRLLVVPTARLPKYIIPGVTASVPAPTPVPERPIVTWGALLITATLPLLLPLIFGANTTWKV